MAFGAAAILSVLALVLLDAHVAKLAADEDGKIAELLERGSFLPLTCLVMILFGAGELARLLQAKGAKPHATFALVMIAALMLAPWLSAAGWLGTGPGKVEGLYWQIVLLAVSLAGGGILLVFRRRSEGSLADLGATILMVFYLGFLGSFAIQLRCGRDIPNQDGAWLLMMAIVVTKCGDIGAYFAGTLWGRRKLAPSISPGKTVEGAVGGLLASAAAAMFFATADRIAAGFGLEGSYDKIANEIAQSFQMPDNISLKFLLLRAAGIGVLLSAAGQVGDLVESCFKRDAGVKDSGRLIPRFGGILDLIDSPLLAVPVAWFLLTV